MGAAAVAVQAEAQDIVSVPNETLRVREFAPDDARAVDRIALSAFSQFAGSYDDWRALAASLSRMSGLAAQGEIVVVDLGSRLVGAVAYIPPVASKAAFFDPDWPVIRMLVTDPDFRRRGVGHALTDACLARAKRDGAKIIALHTSPIMTVALPMYLRMGFTKLRDAPPIFGVEYAVYVKAL